MRLSFADAPMPNKNQVPPDTHRFCLRARTPSTWGWTSPCAWSLRYTAGRFWPSPSFPSAWWPAGRVSSRRVVPWMISKVQVGDLNFNLRLTIRPRSPWLPQIDRRGRASRSSARCGWSWCVGRPLRSLSRSRHRTSHWRSSDAPRTVLWSTERRSSTSPCASPTPMTCRMDATCFFYFILKF